MNIMGKFSVGDKVRVKNVAVGACSNWYTFVDGMSEYIGKEFTIYADCSEGVYMLEGSWYFWAEDWLEPTKLEPTKLEATKLEATKPETIVIYRNGDKTVALDKTTGKKAEAKCSTEDTYDFYTGAKIAFERLIGEDKPKEEPKPKLYNGKVVCTKPACTALTKGKIYEFKDGYSKYDDGDSMPLVQSAIVSFEDLEEKMASEFVELVED